MDEQGGAGGVPGRHGEHASEEAQRRVGEDRDERTAAADTDEASRLDRPAPASGRHGGRRRWTGPGEGSEGAGSEGGRSTS